MKHKILVVGCGFAGATIARVLAENGFLIDLIDQRPHLGGNAFDQLHVNGERVHRYGPHLLHGKAGSAAECFLSRFTCWVPYIHHVRAKLSDGRTTPLPVNRTTLEDVFDVHLATDDEARVFLAKKRVAIDRPNNSEEFFLSSVGQELTDLFFRPYTRKMWGLDPRDLAVSIGARLPVRYTRDDRYFLDDFQALPAEGYTALFERMLGHENISIRLSTQFEESMLADYFHSFLSIPIDVFFDGCYGFLPYRSICFEHSLQRQQQEAPVVNFTNTGVYTRRTAWGMLANSPAPQGALYLVTDERPCGMEDNPGEYYYPVINSVSIDLLRRYQELARKRTEITFCGRTGLFRYLDMMPAVTLHLDMAKKFLDCF